MSNDQLSELIATSRQTAQQIFDLANSYHEAAIRCSEPISPPGVTDRFYAPLIAGVTLISFSCELYFKAISWRENQRPLITHNLKTLFDNLDSDFQASLAARYVDVSATQEIQIEEDLEKLSETFRDWRYIFEEPQSVRIDKLFFLAKTLYLETMTRNSDWAVVNHLHEKLVGAPSPQARELVSLGSGKYVFR